MIKNKLIYFLDNIFKDLNIYFYTIDNLLNKIIIFSNNFILEVSTINRGCDINKSNKLFFYFRKFNDINKIYNFINNNINDLNNKNISILISRILKYQDTIYLLFKKQNKEFFKNTFTKIKINKKVLFILKGGGMEETIEKSFISYCNYSNINLTVLYRYGKGYWGQQLNQDGFFKELKANNPNIKFIYKEDFDDKYIDSMIDENTEVFNFQYDYKGKNKGFNLIILSSVTDYGIDCKTYKNIFSSYESNTIGYSTDNFFNIENSKIHKIFNAQNINLLNNYSIIKPIDNFILSGGMEWARDFSILNILNGDYKGIMISDEKQNINNFLDMYRGIQSYYGFLGTFILSDLFIACHLEEFNNDDRSKMIATAICAGKPVIIPYNKGNIVKKVINNKLGITYKNKKDLFKKVKLFYTKDNLKKYGKRCETYSKKYMDINKFINLIFKITFNRDVLGENK